MGLRIIYGRSGSGKSNFCFSEIAKLIDTDEKIIIITPEQFSFTQEKKLMNCSEHSAVINAEVLTLSRMAHRVMQEIGNNGVSMLSKPAKAMIIYSILDKNKQNLKFLGKSEQNIDLSIQAITEFKKHGIDLKTLKEKLDKMDNEYLKIKLNDIELIYNKFEEQLESKFIDDTDLLKYLADNIEKTEIVKNAIIFIDEFMGFTSQEYEILAKIIKLAKQVNICLCIDKLNFNTNPTNDVFYSNKQTLIKLIKLIDTNKLKLEEPKFLADTPRFKNKELLFLEQNIYNNKSTVYKQKVENLELFLAKNQYSEVENLAKNITMLVKNRNMKYREISVITKDLGTYSSLIRAIFSKYDIPVFIDEKRDLNQNPIIKYILSLLDVINKKFSLESVISYAKTGFIEIDQDELFKLENYCIKWGIKYNKWKQDFTYEISDKNKEQEVKRLNELRKQIIEPICELIDEISKNRTAEEVSKLIYQFMQKQCIDKKTEEKIQKLKEKGLIDLAKEYEKSYEILVNLLDDITTVFKDEKITIEKYINYFKVGLRNSSLGKIPATQDQVIVGDVERSRSHKVKVIFVIGVNDGIFPSNNKDEGFLNDKDREYLKNDGIELANGTMENLYEENFNIYKAFTTAENKLYISYASSNSEGKALRPSMLIIKIKKLFPMLKEKSDLIQKDYEIINETVTYEELLENIYKLNNNEKIDEIWKAVYNYYKEKNKFNLEEDLKGINYTNEPRNIDKKIVDKLYGNVLNTSVSKLEKYRSCPFSYYLQYGLKLKEKEELKIQSFNTGYFMHETIDAFFEYVNKEKVALTTLMEEEKLLEDIVSKIIEEKLKLSTNYIFTATAKYQILVKRLKRIITKALKYIIEGLVNSEFDIKGTEIEFAKNGKFKPITLNLEDGKKVEIVGKIDRIDTCQVESGKYLRIIDYKSSAKNIDLNEVYAGLQIQLLTYLDAVCKQEDFIPAGILYFSLLEQIVKADKKIDAEEIEEEIRKNFKMKGLILADVKIIKLHDKNLETGTSKIVPAALTSSGEVNQRWTSGVSKEEFKILQDYIQKTIKQISKEILSGYIDLKPYNKKGKTPCKYCSYKAICGFSPRNCNNKYNYIPSKPKDEVLKNMRDKINNEES